MTDLDPKAAHLHHLLLVDASVTHEDVDALVRSHYPQAWWLAPDTVVLEPEVELTGPWTVGPELRRQLDAPSWAVHAWLAACPQERGGEVPEALRGLDDIMDAYPWAAPEGRELRTLMFLRAAARRVAGAVHLAGTAVVLEPDPESAVDLTVFAPTSVEPEEVRARLGRDDVVVEGRSPGTWQLSVPAEAGMISIVSEGHPVLPVALTGLPWAVPGTRGYEVRWFPPEDHGRRLTLAQRRVRHRVTLEIERIAGAIASLTQGVAVDDDGFIVALDGAAAASAD